MSREIDELIERIRISDQQRENEKQGFSKRIEEFKYSECENEELIRSLQDELDSLNRLYEDLKNKMHRMIAAEDHSDLQSENQI